MGSHVLGVLESCKDIQYLQETQSIRMLSLLLLALLAPPSSQYEFDVVWTDKQETLYLTEDEHKVAFRDVVVEGMVRRMFDVYLTASRLGDNKTVEPDMMINDPLDIENEIKFKNSQSGLIDVDFQAWDLKLRKVFNRIKDRGSND